MSCGGRGLCGCGRDECIADAWWATWGGLWWFIGVEMNERNNRGDAEKEDMSCH